MVVRRVCYSGYLGGLSPDAEVFAFEGANLRMGCVIWIGDYCELHTEVIYGIRVIAGIKITCSTLVNRAVKGSGSIVLCMQKSVIGNYLLFDRLQLERHGLHSPHL